MGVLSEALELLGLAGGADRDGLRNSGATRTRHEQRELADMMRRLPGRFADRLPARALERIVSAAAVGQWENAVDELIIALHARAETITSAERDELHTVLDALNMPGEHLDALTLQR